MAEQLEFQTQYVPVVHISFHNLPVLTLLRSTYDEYETLSACASWNGFDVDDVQFIVADNMTPTAFEALPDWSA